MALDPVEREPERRQHEAREGPAERVDGVLGRRNTPHQRADAVLDDDDAEELSRGEEIGNDVFGHGAPRAW
jgi:hypothetical protein